MNYLIKNATLVNEGLTFMASVFVSDGKIAKIVREPRSEVKGNACGICYFLPKPICFTLQWINLS